MKLKKVTFLLLSFTLIFLISANVFADEPQLTNKPVSIIEIEGEDGVVSVIESNNKDFDFLMEIVLGVIKNSNSIQDNSSLNEVRPAGVFCCDANFRLKTWTVTHHDWEHYGSGNNCTVTIYEIVACEKCGTIWSDKIINSYKHHHS